MHDKNRGARLIAEARAKLRDLCAFIKEHKGMGSTVSIMDGDDIDEDCIHFNFHEVAERRTVSEFQSGGKTYRFREPMEVILECSTYESIDSEPTFGCHFALRPGINTYGWTDAVACYEEFWVQVVRLVSQWRALGLSEDDGRFLDNLLQDGAPVAPTA